MQAALRTEAAEGMKYWAFISYSSRDAKQWALPLRKRLEAYRVPKSLVGKVVRGELIPTRLKPVFRDRDELAAGPDLPRKIQEALEVSRYLIVVCSPQARCSEYVGKEIQWFKRLGRSDRIIAYIVAGEPADCFREELRYEVDERGELKRDCATEPLAADARAGRDGKDALLKVLAGILGTSFDELKRRDMQQRQRLLVAVGSVAVSIIIFLTALAAWALVERNRANEQTGIAQANARRAEENAQKEARAKIAVRRQLHLARVRLAWNAWEQADVGQVLSLLRVEAPTRARDAPPDDFREFEYHYLARLCFTDLRTLSGHAAPVCHLEFSPDGKALASADGDGWLRMWEPNAGRALFAVQTHIHLPGHSGYTFAFTRDGRKLVGGYGEYKVRVWDAATGKPLLTRVTQAFRVLCVAISPDGRYLACEGPKSTVEVLDLSREGPGLLLSGHKDGVTCVAFSPDGRRLVTGSSDRTVRIWDPSSAKEIRCFQGHRHFVSCVAISPDGTKLASGGSSVGGGEIKVWDLESGRELVTIPGPKRGISSLAFSPEGARLASGGSDRTVRVSDVRTGDELLCIRGHTEEVLGVAFHPDGRRLASGSGDKTVKLWDATAVPLFLTFPTVAGAEAPWPV